MKTTLPLFSNNLKNKKRGGVFSAQQGNLCESAENFKILQTNRHLTTKVHIKVIFLITRVAGS